MTANISDVADKTFDYIVVGGGTSGIALASRLTENPSISVVVLEAGESNLNDPKITIPAQWKLTHTFGDPKYDWMFSTVKQKYSNDRQLIYSRGKGLGGTSAMNFCVWSKPPENEVNNLEKLGNPGWNWDDYFKYSRLSETSHPASAEQTTLYQHTYEPDQRGTSGPIQVTVPHHFPNLETLFQTTMVNKGLKSIKDPYGGDTAGTWVANASVDPKSWTRSYSASAYYLPHQARKNLTVLAEASVTRVLFADTQSNNDFVASGVDLIHTGVTYTVHANKEVLLSAGTIKSPQILELSGIGRPEVLSSIGVDVKVALPGVGENVQEHIDIVVSYEINPELETADVLRDPAHAAEAIRLHAEGKGAARLGLTSYSFFPLSVANPMGAPAFHDRVAKKIDQRKKSGKLPLGLAEQLDLQLATLRDDSLPDMQVIIVPCFYPVLSMPEPGKRYISFVAMINHPLSRGTIHSTSNDPLAQPAIDPHYFQEDFDLELLVHHVEFIRSMSVTEPLKSAIIREVDPGPTYQTEQQIREYAKNTHTPANHTVGSCSMLPREKQGVVDSTLKVYGTTNLRVVDLSIIPLHLACHPQATAYMLAEKASDLIQGIARK